MALDVLDASGDGSVNLEEFVAWFKGGCPLDLMKAAADADALEEAEAMVAAEVLSEVNVE